MMDWGSFSVGNAAGFIKADDSMFRELLMSSASDLTVGSITILERDGNPDVNYVYLPDGTSVNAIGLRNCGLNLITHLAPRMAEQAKSAGKNIRWSFAGFSAEEYTKGAARLCPFGKVELNLGCPNVWGTTGQKPIASFNLELMQRILESVDNVIPGLYDVKLSPYSDPGFIPQVAEVLARHHIEFVVTSNTFPNGLPIPDGRTPALDTPGGFGGVAGNALHHIAVGQVAQFVGALAGSNLKVIGVGGVDTGERLLAMQRAGASGVQMGTAFGERGGRIFSEVFQKAVDFAD